MTDRQSPTRAALSTLTILAASAVSSASCGERPRDVVLVERCLEGYNCTPIGQEPTPPVPSAPDAGDDASAPPELTAPIAPGTTLRELDYRVVDAAYNPQTGQLVVVSDQPQELIVIDAEGTGERRYPLPAKPSAVHVSANGRLAAIGYSSGLGVIDLPTGNVSVTCNAPTDVRQIAITNAGRVFTISAQSGESMQALTVSDAATCSILVEAGAGTDSEGPRLALLQSELSLYQGHGLVMRCRLDPRPGSLGISECVRTAVYESCGGLWVDREDTALYSRCGERFRLLPEPDEPQLEVAERAGGRLLAPLQVDMLTASSRFDRVAVLGRDPSRRDAPGTRVLHVFDATFLDLRAMLGLPPFPTGSEPAPAYGRRVFADATMQTAFVFVQSEPDSGARRDFGLVRIPIPEEVVDGGAPDGGALDGGAPDGEAPDGALP